MANTAPDYAADLFTAMRIHIGGNDLDSAALALYQGVDRLMRMGETDAIRRVLAGITDFPLLFLLGALSITFPMRDRFREERAEVVRQVRLRADIHLDPRVLLRGLE